MGAILEIKILRGYSLRYYFLLPDVMPVESVALRQVLESAL